MTALDTLETIASLDDLEALVRDASWTQYLTALVKREDHAEEEARLRRAVVDAKGRLSPELACPELQTLKARVYSGAAAPAELRTLLTRIAALRAELPVRRHERAFGRLETTIGQMFAASNAGTGYSNRARRAQNLFTEYAGQTRIAGAATDRHGNAAGTGYDLGRDGAFEGHAVHVLHLYTGEGFDFVKPTAAFERKGFRVERRTTPETPASLRAWLSDAKQLWLISDMKVRLTADHIEVVREFWQRGGALYIWGDNEPYYVDANAVLAALFGPAFAMKGNTPGGQVVHEIGPARRGFQPHLATTGLAHLFEGITVASLDEAVAAQHGFAPLLYGSAGNLITVVRDPTPTSGAVAVDGAFTRLYCQWDDAGSARYVCNAACFLAAMTLPDEAPAPDADAEPDAEQDALPFDPRGAFQGACDLTGEAQATWLVLSVAEMADALRNTSDAVLTDPLAAGAQNCIFSDRLYGEAMAPWIVEQGSDPFTRRPVVACLPLVDLASPRNFREFTVLLCKCLMGGKYLPTAARLLFFAVVDQMLDDARGTARPEAWRYLYQQCLQNFTSTPDFTEVGRKIPLLDAMAAYFSPATDEMVQLRGFFASVCAIGRTLLREGRATPAQVGPIATRALIKAVVTDAVAAEKAAPGTVRPEVVGLLYHNFCGIPTLRGARLVAQQPAFVRDVAATRQRIERDVGVSLLTPAGLAVVLHALSSLDLRQYTAETALQHMLRDAAFGAVWRSESPGDVLALLNARFAAYAAPLDLTDPHMAQVPPFATTYGPSVYRCTCGRTFGDPMAPLTPDALLALRDARTAHFREVYRVAASAGWYPGQGTLHCNLHRAVQAVIKGQYPDAMDATADMTAAVAAYLRHDGKGFVCDPTLEQGIQYAIESYLLLRRVGQPHPEGVLTLEVKAARERRMVYGAAADAAPGAVEAGP